jgi:TRAP-type C4-dicarboxylate transport system substrate-binding protein
VLTLAVHEPGGGVDDSLNAAARFAAAVGQLSRGSIRVAVHRTGPIDGGEHERGIVDDLRAGRSELGIVGVQAWDRFGVRSFDALEAPFLVDSLALERRVLEGALAARMLAGVHEAGVVGLALLPGTLRRPLGISRRLVTRADYRGAQIGVRPGRLAQATFSALALTANVVLWPSAHTIVISRTAFEELDAAQRDILRRAAREAIARVTEIIANAEADANAALCERRSLAVVTASGADRAALIRAVRPVYEALARDRQTRELIAAITKLRGDLVAPDAVECRNVRSAEHGRPASPLDGVWRVRVTRRDLLAIRLPPGVAAAVAGTWMWEIEGDRATVRNLDTGDVWTVRLAIDGRVLTVTAEKCPTDFELQCFPGHASVSEWSVYRNRLTLTPIPGRAAAPQSVAKPWTRIGSPR